MTPTGRTRGGRRAPLSFALLLVAACSVAGPAAGGDVAAAVAASAGTELVVLDERLVATGRLPLGAPLAALAVSDARDRTAYAAMRDGRVLKVDLERGSVVAETRVGAAASAIAASSDGRYLAVAASDPAALVVLDGDLRQVRELPARDLEGRRSSAVTALVDMPGRRSFLAALPGLPEVWEVSYDDDAPPIFPGLVHDYRHGEAIPLPGKFNARRVPLDAPVDDLLADPDGADLLASARGVPRLQVLNLHVRRRIAEVDSLAPASAAARRPGLLAVTRGDVLRLVDPRSWRDLADVPLGGTATLVRTQPASPHAWAIVRGAPDGGDRLLRVDVDARRVSGEVPLPDGARTIDMAFAAGGADVLVLVDGPRPGLVRVDAATLAQRSGVALAAPVLLAVPAHRRTATSK